MPWMVSSAVRKNLSGWLIPWLKASIDIVALDIIHSALSVHILCAVRLISQFELEEAYVETNALASELLLD